MTSKLKCFISYAHVDREFVHSQVLPVLKTKGLDIWIDSEQIPAGVRIYDTILKGIKEADFILAVFNRRSTWLTFEIGAAIGQDKPTIGIIREYNDIPSDLQHIQYIRYQEDNVELFKINLNRVVEAIFENVIDISQIKIHKNEKLIGIKVGIAKSNFEDELKFTTELVTFVSNITKSKSIKLVNVAKGSFKSLISLDLKEWAELIEKIVFFIPELKKKKEERKKIVAETKKLNAEADKLTSESNRINVESKITLNKSELEQAHAMADLLLKYKDLGIKIQFSDKILIDVSKENGIEIKEPKILKSG